MITPRVTRPKFPVGYVDRPASFLTWEWVAAQLTESKHYWLCSVRPPSSGAQGGRPHVVPRWGVFIDDTFYYDGSPETRHARNIEENPYVSLHLESGSEVIIMDGRSAAAGKPSSELANRLSKAFKKKYKELGYAPKPDNWDHGGLFVFTPSQCIAWSNFTKDPTKFVFDSFP
jgi:hypothetical protein